MRHLSRVHAASDSQPGLPLGVWTATRCPDAFSVTGMSRPRANRQMVQNASRGRGGIRIHSIGSPDLSENPRSPPVRSRLWPVLALGMDKALNVGALQRARDRAGRVDAHAGAAVIAVLVDDIAGGSRGMPPPGVGTWPAAARPVFGIQPRQRCLLSSMTGDMMPDLGQPFQW